MGVPQNRLFIMENPAKMDENWGYPYFRKLLYIYMNIVNDNENKPAPEFS